jgi:diadenosine tetraphosphate (Ap4A) HIT family hydrolase
MRIVFFIASILALHGIVVAQQSSAEYQVKKAKGLAAPSPFTETADKTKDLVYEDDAVIGFKPTSLQAPVHVLIVPKRRIPTFNDLTDADSLVLGRMMLAAKRIAAKLGIAESGYRLVLNTNENAGQSVFHIHLHLLGGMPLGPMVDQTWRKQNSPVPLQQAQEFNLSSLFENGKIKGINREVQVIRPASSASQKQDSVPYLQLSEKAGEGLVWLPLDDFQQGTITVEMRGKDVVQRSFIGIAFHGANDTTYDAVYCRPFNFFAKDSVRRIHAIQYISHPTHTWKKLREERNGVFEKEIVNPPKPDEWLTLRLVVEKTTVKAFINAATTASLVIEKLNNRTSGKIGLFVADNSGGDFRKIVVIPSTR